MDKLAIISNLKNNGYFVVNNLINQNLLLEINNTLVDSFNYDHEKRKGYAGFKMGNLSTKDCYLHQIIFDELIELIELLEKEFNYLYITGGGNFNLPKSRPQRLHFDNIQSNLTINIPLVRVTLENGPLSIIPTPCSERYTTAMFIKERLYKRKKYITTELGDVILRFSNIWHAGTANNSNIPRPMLTLTLRSDFPYKDNESKESHLIKNKKFSGEIGFYGNVYPNNIFGKIIEICDILIPPLSKSIQHGYNLVRRL